MKHRYQQILNKRYANLCQRLGDLQTKKKSLEKAIAELEDQIKLLDSSHPVLAELENELIAELLKPNQEG